MRSSYWALLETRNVTDGAKTRYYLGLRSIVTIYDDGAVASGELDDQIGYLVDALQHTLKRPAYLRIGYEFNGQWNGYSKHTYPKAFARVAKAVRSTKKVATVWDYSADASKERLNWLDWVVDPELMDWAGAKTSRGFSQSVRCAFVLSQACRGKISAFSIPLSTTR